MDPNTLQNNINAVAPEASNTPNNTPNNPTPVAPTPAKPQKSKGLIIGMAACAVLAVAGIGFGVYGMLTANQKSAEISELKTDVENKTTEIAELESTISDLNAKSEVTEVASTATIESEQPTEAAPEVNQNESAETASIVLGAILDENETRKVFEIGNCTADGPSVKCSVNTIGGESLISYNSNDSILRLSIPNN